MSAMQRSNAALPSGYVVSYDQVLSTGETNAFLSSICRVLLDRLSPAGWTAAGVFIADCLTSGDFPSLVLYDPDVLDLEAADVAIIRQCLACFSKRVDIDIGVDREAAARDKFRAAEVACARTNAKFRAWQEGRFTFGPLVESVLHRSQRKIAKLLEAADLLDPVLDDFRPRFGPGATTQTPKKNACLGLKLNDVPACSTYLGAHAPALLARYGAAPLRAADEMEVELPLHHGKLSYVPKNAKTYRTTETQPVFNSYWQLGIGDRLAKVLRHVGIDIRDQSANQRAAMYGSISGALATLDLSSASDTICTKLVEHLLPEQWFDLLSLFRVDEVVDKVDGRIRLSKFSGMGNGFTFPLETLLFWAISSSTVEVLGASRQRVLVYGDDIIVDAAAAPVVASVLESLGFTINTSKSFWTGRFRESCGADYIFGHNVRPCYVDGPLTGADFFRLHNFFARNYPEIARACEKVIHPSIRLRGPQGYGDGHLHAAFWVSKPVKVGRKGERAGWSGYHFETWTHSVKELHRKIRDAFVRREKGGTVTFHRRSFALATAIATYTVESREGERWWVPRFTERGVRIPETPASLRQVALNFREEEDANRAAWVIPGTGELKRTRVYTFETPLA